MKVILMQDVARIGKRYEIATVPDGYALNMLIPKKMAQPATPENMKRLQAQKDRVGESQAAVSASVADVIEKLKAAPHAIVMEANEQGHLFQGLKAEHIASSLTEAGMAISANHIELAEPIKAVGEHEVTITDGTVNAKVTFVVNAK